MHNVTTGTVGGKNESRGANNAVGGEKSMKPRAPTEFDTL